MMKKRDKLRYPDAGEIWGKLHAEAFAEPGFRTFGGRYSREKLCEVLQIGNASLR